MGTDGPPVDVIVAAVELPNGDAYCIRRMARPWSTDYIIAIVTKNSDFDTTERAAVADALRRAAIRVESQESLTDTFTQSPDNQAN